MSLACDWQIYWKLVLFRPGSCGKQVVWNNNMENACLKLCFNPPKPLQSKSGENATYCRDFVENWRWHAMFSCAYNILGATKLLIIECRLGGIIYNAVLSEWQKAALRCCSLYSPPRSQYILKAIASVYCHRPTSAFSYHHLQRGAFP